MTSCALVAANLVPKLYAAGDWFTFLASELQQAPTS